MHTAQRAPEEVSWGGAQAWEQLQSLELLLMVTFGQVRRGNAWQDRVRVQYWCRAQAGQLGTDCITGTPSGDPSGAMCGPGGRCSD